MRRMWKGEVEAKIRRKKSYDLETRLNPPDISFNPLSVWHIHHFPLISRCFCFRYLGIGGLLQYQYQCYFLVACTRLYISLCPSVRPSVRPSVGPSVRPTTRQPDKKQSQEIPKPCTYDFFPSARAAFIGIMSKLFTFIDRHVVLQGKKSCRLQSALSYHLKY